ncbi:hypothetical protein EOA50_26340 [Mesorhizobium sp. M1A.F.Ca.IN.020.30.1.1]|uniref:hypothetical protein n=1 Tax=unclassified Mesorhizobium TaxID=325217 RepID=UPI000FD19021|nr:MULTISPECIES: hypothetical protein [unclassified Mesorhizobium]RUV69500.1 hypothetical protein EOA50_26340 [Mesorhizobium sp. M1A.F.Ca.IN.020.30.1.1]RWG36694.1 MAG: hypothetical protein EOQ59_20340 [Mesorhizobium sp.]RWG73610.1 MAG: hypothetical protein EOQ66_07760 [Mesorhizobium sp.]TIM76587.1 MAG: hypothetical protein E5Y44_10655 [Mesorhizobium sp.]TIM86797.1 MAG: hypothetical protein E5Y43_20510 [Mesorhizobium sp.]
MSGLVRLSLPQGLAASALAFEASYGLGEGLAYLAPDDEEELFSALRLDRFLHARVDKMLLEQFQRAKRIIERERLEVDRVISLDGFAVRRNSASSEKSWLRRLTSETGFRASRHFPLSQERTEPLAVIALYRQSV